MQVKKFRAKTIKEATDKVKASFGSEALIVSTKKITRDGKYDLFEISAISGENNCHIEDMDHLVDLKAELMSIKEMIYILNHSTGIYEKLMMVPFALNMYKKMIKNGVNDQNIKLLLERAGVFNGYAADRKNNIKKNIIKEVIRAFEVKDPFEKKDNKQRIAALIGTTGVGKTTTIAKLAAQLMLKERKKVGLISVDTYRIGAMEQLKTYANILGIPCFQAFKRKDILFALRSMKGKDVILVDTAGQSQYDLTRIEELRKMITGDLAISSHLLLSVSTTASEMEKTALNFSPLKFQSYIFTKIDEAEKCGSIINQIMKLNLPISYITTGQNVPEDIECADKGKILDLVLNRN